MSRSGLYKHYSGTLSTDLEIPYYTLYKANATGGYIANDGQNSFTVNFKFNELDVYNEPITVNGGEILDLTGFPPFYSVKLIYSASTTYRMLIGQFKTRTY